MCGSMCGSTCVHERLHVYVCRDTLKVTPVVESCVLLSMSKLDDLSVAFREQALRRQTLFGLVSYDYECRWVLLVCRITDITRTTLRLHAFDF